MGTNLWTSERRGILNAPVFGQVISKDKFSRVLRYLARGPVGCEDELTDDPWSEVRWLVDEFNAQRRVEFKCGWGVVPDGSVVE